MVDTDVLADHRVSCVEKAQASGEPCARKRASTVWEGAVGKGPRSGYHLERSRQVGAYAGTSLAAYFIPCGIARAPLSQTVRAACHRIRLSPSPVSWRTRFSEQHQHTPLSLFASYQVPLARFPPNSVGFTQFPVLIPLVGTTPVVCTNHYGHTLGNTGPPSSCRCNPV
jgi:hypothetical protein